MGRIGVHERGEVAGRGRDAGLAQLPGRRGADRPGAQLKEAVGLSHPQYEILVRLAGAPGGELRMTELAGTLLSSKSGLTYQVTQLEKAGLVARRSCPSDVRGVLAVLTKAGRRKLALPRVLERRLQRDPAEVA